MSITRSDWSLYLARYRTARGWLGLPPTILILLVGLPMASVHAWSGAAFDWINDRAETLNGWILHRRDSEDDEDTGTYLTPEMEDSTR